MKLFKTITVAGDSYELSPKLAEGGGLKIDESTGGLAINLGQNNVLKVNESGYLALNEYGSVFYSYEGQLKMHLGAGLHQVSHQGGPAMELAIGYNNYDLLVTSEGLSLSFLPYNYISDAYAIISEEAMGLTRMMASGRTIIVPNIAREDRTNYRIEVPSMSEYNVGYLKFAYENGGLFIPLAKEHSLVSSAKGLMVNPDWVLGLATLYLKVNEDGSLSKK